MDYLPLLKQKEARSKKTNVIEAIIVLISFTAVMLYGIYNILINNI